jgi:hypothetical protein
LAFSFNSATPDFSGKAWTTVTAAPLTIVAWFNPAAVTAQMVIGGVITSGGTAQGYSLVVRGNVASDPLAATDAGTATARSSINGCVANSWQHGAGVFVSATSRTVYLNGTAGATDTTDTTTTSTGRLEVGRARSGAGTLSPFNGSLAEFAIYNAALDADEVAALAKGYSPRMIRPSALMAYVPLTASVLVDLRGAPLTSSGSPAVSDHPRIIYPRGYQRPRFAAAGAGAYTITGGTGSFTETGNAANLLFGRKVAGGTGAFALTGNSSNLLFGRKVAAGLGTFALTGNATGLRADRKIAGGTGSYSFTGIDLTFLKGRTLTADLGTYALTGIPVGFSAARRITASAASYALTGIAVSLNKGATMSAGAAAFTLSGIDAAFRRTVKMPATVATFTLTGNSTGLAYGRVLTASVRSYTLSGITTAFKRGYVVAPGTGVFVFTGNAVVLESSGAHPLPTVNDITPLIAFRSRTSWASARARESGDTAKPRRNSRPANPRAE